MSLPEKWYLTKEEIDADTQQDQRLNKREAYAPLNVYFCCPQPQAVSAGVGVSEIQTVKKLSNTKVCLSNPIPLTPTLNHGLVGSNGFSDRIISG
jgi:hypothetical protein